MIYYLYLYILPPPKTTHHGQNRGKIFKRIVVKIQKNWHNTNFALYGVLYFQNYCDSFVKRYADVLWCVYKPLLSFKDGKTMSFISYRLASTLGIDSFRRFSQQGRVLFLRENIKAIRADVHGSWKRGIHLTPATEQGEGRSETATTDGIRETGLRKVSFHTVISALSQCKRSAFGLPRLL